jgi:hypothetical protein
MVVNNQDARNVEVFPFVNKTNLSNSAHSVMVPRLPAISRWNGFVERAEVSRFVSMEGEGQNARTKSAKKPTGVNPHSYSIGLPNPWQIVN